GHLSSSGMGDIHIGRGDGDHRYPVPPAPPAPPSNVMAPSAPPAPPKPPKPVHHSGGE
ncbi:MAG: hypothetical protein JSR81_17315, partial [Proteobacteria bacterium]|nr:hypothetical protein [Pseudomonadota bacterium]